MSAPSVGDPAPLFDLPGTGGRTYSLAERIGQGTGDLVTVLVFYPGDHSPVCTAQLNAYANDFSAFGQLGATVWAVSPQSVESHEGFLAEHGFPFPLLADIDKGVGAAYGILGPVGFYRRSVFVVDCRGIVRYAHRALSGLTFRTTGELMEAVRTARGA